MQYWLTVHHPPEKEAEIDPGKSGIWVQRRHTHRYGDLRQGDRVLIYETLSGPARWLEFPDGRRRRSRYYPGKGGVVGVGLVVEVTSNHPITLANQDDGEIIEWAQLAILETEPLTHPVSRREVNAALGLQPNAVMRGFGGFRRITAAQFETITRKGKGGHR